MKKSILILALFLISFTAFTQITKTTQQPAKTDTTKKQVITKPTFSFDPSTVYHINLDMTAEQIGIFTIKRNEWKLRVERNPQFSGQQIGNFEDFDDQTKQNIQDQLLALQKAEIEKFKADTTKFKPIKKK